ncbi:MAG: DNA primase, partial [Acholeplasmataceae bacterium]
SERKILVDQQILEKINSQTNIVDLVSEFVELQKSGKNFKGLCPFHNEKSPSFFVSPEKNIAKCFSCGGGGQPLTFYKQIKNISFKKAIEELAKRANINLPNQKPKDKHEHVYQMFNEAQKFFSFTLNHTELGKQAMDYLLKRGLTKETIEHFDIGCAPAFGDTLYQLLRDKSLDVNQMLEYSLVRQKEDGTYYDMFTSRITFPIKDMNGNIVGFSGRTLSKDNQVKYMNSPESPVFKKGQLLYHAFDAQKYIRKNNRVILHEGFFDVISSYQAGYKEAVATMGTSLTKEQAQMLSQLSHSVIIGYDGDNAGFEATNKAIKRLEPFKLKVDILHLPEQLDPDEYIKKYGVKSYQERMQLLKDPYDYQYMIHKNQKDFSKSHDRIAFKDAILKMLKGSDPAVQSLYKTRLSVDLNMSIEDLDITPTATQVMPKKAAKKTVKDKYFMAEIGLIIAMMRSNEIALKAKEALTNQHFADKNLSMIRYTMIKFYENHSAFDLKVFIDMLKDEEKEIFETDVLSDMDYVNQLPKTSHDVDIYIKTIQSSIDIRRLRRLNEKRKQVPTNAPLIVSERDDLIKKMNGVK